MFKFQEKRIAIIKELLPQFGDNFILKGGTALTLFYSCPRFSEDIDLDSKTNNMNFLSHLKLSENWDINIKKNTDTVFRVMIDYKGNKNGGAYPLKIEVSSRNKNFINNDLTFSKINGVQVYDLNVLANMKAEAFCARTKARDVFDVGYLLAKNENFFSKDWLRALYNQISIKGLDDLVALLKIEQDDAKTFSNIDPDIFVLELEKNCKEKLLKIMRERNNYYNEMEM